MRNGFLRCCSKWTETRVRRNAFSKRLHFSQPKKKNPFCRRAEWNKQFRDQEPSICVTRLVALPGNRWKRSNLLLILVLRSGFAVALEIRLARYCIWWISLSSASVCRLTVMVSCHCSDGHYRYRPWQNRRWGQTAFHPLSAVSLFDVVTLLLLLTDPTFNVEHDLSCIFILLYIFFKDAVEIFKDKYEKTHLLALLKAVFLSPAKRVCGLMGS